MDILFKRSGESGKIPTTDTVKFGELLLNYADGCLYFKDINNQIRYLKACDPVEDAGLANMYSGYYGGTLTINLVVEQTSLTAGYTLDDFQCKLNNVSISGNIVNQNTTNSNGIMFSHNGYSCSFSDMSNITYDRVMLMSSKMWWLYVTDYTQDSTITITLQYSK